ncbi:MAG TPA: zinc ribbon domain-containing protein [Candidatus Saccharimonadales bacterium]|nr:zinc ribbon domain-containing protein [Candidatus Saccharimonadales bacterium]
MTTSIVATVTTPIEFSTTSTSTVPVYVFANPAAEFGVLIVGIAAILSITFVVIKARRGAKTIICPSCGHVNPPHATRFCVNCGKPLSK